MAQALRLTALGMRSRRQLCVSNCEAYELVVLPWIPVLACAKFAERGEFGNVDIVVHECVWLLHDDNIGIWAREAPEYHGRCPEGTAVIDFERQALFVAPQVLKTVGEEVSTLPVAEADDVSHVTAVVREAVKRRPEIARDSAKPCGLEGAN
jgi:hypothetical protein